MTSQLAALSQWKDNKVMGPGEGEGEGEYRRQDLRTTIILQNTGGL